MQSPGFIVAGNSFQLRSVLEICVEDMIIACIEVGSRRNLGRPIQCRERNQSGKRAEADGTTMCSQKSIR